MIALTQLPACGVSVIPGQHMDHFENASSISVPVTENNAAILKKLNIKTIDAHLIVDVEKNINNRSLGVDNVANHYFDYRIGSKTIKGTPEKEAYTQYLVGPRDVLNITVWEHPELTIPAGEFRQADQAGTIVGEDGNIFFPYAGVIKAADRTVEQIREELTQKLSRFIEQVQLDVRVTAYKSQRVYVVGEVNTPGIQMVKDVPLTVLEAINSAGGVKNDKADLRNLTLTRGDKSYSINLLSLYEGGNLNQNVLLKHGDVLNVPDNEFNKVFVLGETTRGNTFQGTSRAVLMNKARMTLTEALSEGGGPNQETSDPARVFVFRGGMGKPEIFHLDAKSPDAFLLADRFPLQPRDIVFVDRAEGIRWNQIISEIQPTMTLLNVFNGFPGVRP